MTDLEFRSWMRRLKQSVLRAFYGGLWEMANAGADYVLGPLDKRMPIIETWDDVFHYRPRLTATSLDGAVGDDIVLIKYLDEYKFTRMVRASALYFRRHDLLRRQDELEGKVAPYNIALDHMVEIKYGKFDRQQRELHRQAYEQIWLANAFISCFNVDGQENERMYREYVRDNNGVAIFTTIGKLRSLCGDGGAGGGKAAVIARVHYIDTDSDPMLESEADFPAYYKDDCYAWENELRFMIKYTTGTMHGPYGVYGWRWPKFEYRPVVLSSFIDKILIAPQSREGYLATVKGLLKANHADIAVEWSTFPRIQRT